jgi:hypothetical protein
MNRKIHVQETLEKNILDNNKKLSKFLLLDYNSSDGLDEIIQRKFANHIHSGKLVYYRTNTPKYYSMAHSRNLAFKLCESNIICNLDADNFTGKDFDQFILDTFENFNNIFLSPIGGKSTIDCLGRLCVRKKDFISIRGFNEQLANYGYDDYDIVNRLLKKKLRRVAIPDNYLRAITHDNTLRNKNMTTYNHLHSVFVLKQTQNSFWAAYLFKDNTAKLGKFFVNKSFRYCLEEDWIEYCWKYDNNDFYLTKLGEEIKLHYKIEKKSILLQLTMLFDQINNLIQIRRTSVQSSVFGNGIVYKNFISEKIIIL